MASWEGKWDQLAALWGKSALRNCPWETPWRYEAFMVRGLQYGIPAIKWQQIFIYAIGGHNFHLQTDFDSESYMTVMHTLNIITMVLFRETLKMSTGTLFELSVEALIKLGWVFVPTYFVEEFGLGNISSPRRDRADLQLFICLQQENSWHLPPAELQIEVKWNTGSLWSKTICFSSELNRVLLLSLLTGQKFTWLCVICPFTFWVW